MESNDRRKSTIIRHNLVHDAYIDVIDELGDYATLVSKSYIYERIRQRTGLCHKTISYIINHTEKKQSSINAFAFLGKFVRIMGKVLFAPAINVITFASIPIVGETN